MWVRMGSGVERPGLLFDFPKVQKLKQIFKDFQRLVKIYQLTSVRTSAHWRHGNPGLILGFTEPKTIGRLTNQGLILTGKEVTFFPSDKLDYVQK